MGHPDRNSDARPSCPHSGQRTAVKTLPQVGQLDALALTSVPQDSQ
jgi:hypothetical protein